MMVVTNIVVQIIVVANSGYYWLVIPSSYLLASNKQGWLPVTPSGY